MAYSPQIDDHGGAGFVPETEVARSDLKFGVARMREALAPEIGHSEFNQKSVEICFGHVPSELSRRVHIGAALAIEQVAT